MSQAFTATWRMFLPYTVDGVLHKAYALCRIALDGSDYKLEDRVSGANAYVWTLGAEKYGLAMGQCVPSGVTYGTMELQHKVGFIWQTQDTHTYSGSPGASTYVKGSQITLTLRDSAFNKVKIVELDITQQLPAKYNAWNGGSSSLDAFVGPFTENSTDDHDPWHWIQSRSMHFLADSPFVSVKLTLNSQLENKRGV